MRALYPGRHPGTLAAAQGGGAEQQSSDRQHGLLRVALAQGVPETGGGHARPARTSLAPSGLGARPIHSPSRGGRRPTGPRSVADRTPPRRPGRSSGYGQPAVTLSRTSRSTSAVQLFAGRVPLPDTSSVIVFLLPAGPVR